MGEQKEYKSITVEKLIPVNYDLGNLSIFDPNPLDSSKLSDSKDKENYIKDITRDNVQLLINQILSLPVKQTTDSNASSGEQNSTMTLISLPDPTTPLPREKSVPKGKEPTRWELFAAKKGKE
ncbi:unnamed protein product [[Candida] boidinii]|nr:unnamed protein product [[Candida] boidinii]